MMSECTNKLLAASFFFCIICIIFCMSVSAIDLDNEWHEVNQIGVNFSNADLSSFSSVAQSIVVPKIYNAPCILNDVGYNREYVSGVFLTIPIVGDTWQCDASEGLEFRFVLASEDAYFQEFYACRYYYDALPMDGGNYQSLGAGQRNVYQTRFKGITDEELLTAAYINGDADGLTNDYDIAQKVQLQPLLYDEGVIYDVVIKKDILPDWAKSVTFFIGTRSALEQRRICINSVAVRNYGIYDDTSILLEILQNIREVGGKQGLSADDIRDAVKEAYADMVEEEIDVANTAVTYLDAQVSELTSQLRLDSIQESIDSIGTLFDFSSNIQPFIVDVPRVVLNLGGRDFVAFPGVTWNISAEVNNLLQNARQQYPRFNDVYMLCGIVLTIAFSISAIKIMIGLILQAFTPEKQMSVNNTYNYYFDDNGNGGGGASV